MVAAEVEVEVVAAVVKAAEGEAVAEVIEISSDDEAGQLTKRLEGSEYGLHHTRTKKVNRQPAAPFITSTLQQEAMLRPPARRNHHRASPMLGPFAPGGRSHQGSASPGRLMCQEFLHG